MNLDEKEIDEILSSNRITTAANALIEQVTKDEEIKEKAEDEVNKDQEDDESSITLDSHFFSDYELVGFEKKFYSLSPTTKEARALALAKAEQKNQILDGDHPLLERFQKSLKAQLLKKIDALRVDVADLELACKKDNADKEILGVEAYEAQQVINKQQETIEIVLKDLDNVGGALEEMDHRVQQALEEEKVLKAELQEAERNELQLRTELESTDLLVKHMQKWEQEIEGELLVNQRVLDKTLKNKHKAAEEKRQQDLLIYKLNAEVWKLEGELETMLMQIRVKEADRERLAEAAALANIDVEAAQSEHRCLLHGWNSILVTIARRDKYYNSLVQEQQKMQDKVLSVNCEISQLKKQVHKEHKLNEHLTLMRDSVDLELKQCHRTINAEMEKRNNLLRAMADNENLTEQSDRDYELLKYELGDEKRLQSVLLREIEECNNKKFAIEHEMLKHVQENSIINYAGTQLQNQYADLKEANRNLLINIASLEYEISEKKAALQNFRMDNRILTDTLDSNVKQLRVEENQLDALYKEHEVVRKIMSRMMKSYGVLKENMTAINLKETSSEIKELSQYEMRIKQLEASIVEMTDKNREAQNFWLREQAIVVDLSEKRQTQMNEINLLKKQITILDQKNLKLTDELEAYARQEEEITRHINVLQNKMQLLTANLNKRKDSKEQLNFSNNKIQQELVAKLEDCEFESLKLKAEITEIEEDKYTLSRELIEKNREFLAWEKKLTMVNEAKQSLQESRMEGSEIGQMKSEIHRMNVRYGQLKRAQEKLLSDLDNCVSRRDSIVTMAESKTRSVKGASQKWRINFNKKMEDCRNKLAQLQKDVELVGLNIEKRTSELEKIEKTIENAIETVETNNVKIDDVQSEIVTCQINKQLNLDILLFKQGKLKIYAELARKRLPYVYFKTPTVANNAYIRERELNSKLRIIIEDLQLDFPQYQNFWTKTHNSLVVPALNL